jgi:hypothetical protein
MKFDANIFPRGRSLRGRLSAFSDDRAPFGYLIDRREFAPEQCCLEGCGPLESAEKESLICLTLLIRSSNMTAVGLIKSAMFFPKRFPPGSRRKRPRVRFPSPAPLYRFEFSALSRLTLGPRSAVRGFFAAIEARMRSALVLQARRLSPQRLGLQRTLEFVGTSCAPGGHREGLPSNAARPSPPGVFSRVTGANIA